MGTAGSVGATIPPSLCGPGLACGLGHRAALTIPRMVIHHRAAATLPAGEGKQSASPHPAPNCRQAQEASRARRTGESKAQA